MENEKEKLKQDLLKQIEEQESKAETTYGMMLQLILQGSKINEYRINDIYDINKKLGDTEWTLKDMILEHDEIIKREAEKLAISKEEMSSIFTLIKSEVNKDSFEIKHYEAYSTLMRVVSAIFTIQTTSASFKNQIIETLALLSKHEDK